MAHSPWNKSHCYDPTAKAALDNIDKKRLKHKNKRTKEPIEPITRISSQLDNYTKRKLFKLRDDRKGE